MFSKINNKIKYGIMLFAAVVIVLENLIVFFSIRNVVNENFKKTTEEAVSLSYNNINSYFSLTFNLVDLNVNDEHFYQNIINNELSLNSLKVPSLNIIGVVLYDLNNNIYYSDGMGGIVSLDQFKENKNINDFFADSSKNNFLSIRNDLINKYYVTNQPYDVSLGIISYISKIFNNNQLVGYLFIDINPKTLYDKFFSYNQYHNMSNTITLIKTNDLDILGINNNYTINQSKFLVYNQNELLNITSYVPLINSNKHLLTLYLPILIFSLIVLILAIIVSLIYSKRIVNKLSLLNKKMNDSDNLINDIIKNKTSVN